MNPTLESVRSKIIKCLPPGNVGMVESERVWEEACRRITLADVLLAIETSGNRFYVVSAQGGFVECFNQTLILTKAYWNLRADDLSLQSQETLNFLDQIL